MYSFGATGARGAGGILQQLARMIPALSTTPWSLSLTWHPGVGLTAGIFPGVSGVTPGAIPTGIGPGPLAAPIFPGALYGAAAPYVQGAGVPVIPSAISPLAAAPFAPSAVSPLGYGYLPSPYTAGAMPYAAGAMPYVQGAAFMPGGAFGPAGLPYMGAPSELAYAPYGGLS